MRQVKSITFAVGLAASAAAFAAPASDAQINQLQTQLQSLQSQISSLQSGAKPGDQQSGSASMMFGTYAPLTWQMMSFYSPVGREQFILDANKQGKLSGITLGGYAKAVALWQISNQTSSQFFNPVFATAGNTNKNATGVQLPLVGLLATVNFNEWATGHVQLDSQYLGETSTLGGGNNVNFRQAYLLMGNLNKSSWYGFAGKKDIDFGYFGSVNIYAQPLNRLAFAAAGTTLGVGYQNYGFNVVGSVINGGYGTGSQNLYTDNNATLDNFAVNMNYGMNTKGADWKVGAGYLQGINREYARDAQLRHNGAWDINGQISYMNFDVLAEFTASVNNVNSGFTQATDAHLMAWNVGAAYNFPFMGRDSKVSAGYSQLKGLSDGDFRQYVVGARNEVYQNVWAGIEYSYSVGGLVPDNNGGGNWGDTYGLLIRRTAHVNTVVLDLTAAF